MTAMVKSMMVLVICTTRMLMVMDLVIPMRRCSWRCTNRRCRSSGGFVMTDDNDELTFPDWMNCAMKRTMIVTH